MAGIGGYFSVPATPLSAVTPVADNEADAALRTGLVGTAAEAARADHNHPIRRQANPGNPTLSIGGAGGTLSSSQVLAFWSDEESVSYHMRCEVSMTAGSSWAWVNVPTKAGFQQPDIYAIGTYRTQSATPQNDNAGGTGGAGAAPLGPYMGNEAHHWSSTNRVYVGFYRRDVAYTTYVEFTVKYTRS